MKKTLSGLFIVLLTLNFAACKKKSSTEEGYSASGESKDCTVTADNGTVDGSSFWNYSKHNTAFGTNCALDQLMMNNFLYLVGSDNNETNPRFMKYAPWYIMFPASGTPAWSGKYSGLANAHLATPANQEQAGDDFQLLDVNSMVTSYDLRVNETFFNYVVSNNLYTEAGLNTAYAAYQKDDQTGGIWLPPTSSDDTGEGSVEIKTSWRDFGPATNGYCPTDLMHCETDDTGNSWGLVGMHLVQKTINQGQFIWATFEHVANAPDCSPDNSNPIAQNPADPANSGQTINVNKNISSLSGKTGWNYFNYSNYTTQGGDGKYCGYPGLLGSKILCLQSPYNNNAWKQINICRTEALKLASDTSCAEAQSDPSNLLTTSCLNRSVLSNFSATGLDSKWKNYQLVGMEWLVSGSTGASGAPLKGCFSYEGSPDCQSGAGPEQGYSRAGNVNLANATMETWMQFGIIVQGKDGSTITATDCLDCHQPPTASYNGSVYQGDMSHIFDRVTRAQ